MKDRTLSFIESVELYIMVAGLVIIAISFLLNYLDIKYAAILLMSGLALIIVTIVVTLVHSRTKKQRTLTPQRKDGVLATYTSVAPYHCPLDHDSETPGICPRCGLTLEENQNSSTTKA